MISADDPIGGLILDATKRAQRKALGVHTSTAECGCEVRVTFFSKESSTLHMDRCHEHPVRRQLLETPAKRRGVV